MPNKNAISKHRDIGGSGLDYVNSSINTHAPTGRWSEGMKTSGAVLGAKRAQKQSLCCHFAGDRRKYQADRVRAYQPEFAFTGSLPTPQPREADSCCVRPSELKPDSHTKGSCGPCSRNLRELKRKPDALRWIPQANSSGQDLIHPNPTNGEAPSMASTQQRWPTQTTQKSTHPGRNNQKLVWTNNHSTNTERKIRLQSLREF